MPRAHRYCPVPLPAATKQGLPHQKMGCPWVAPGAAGWSAPRKPLLPSASHPTPSGFSPWTLTFPYPCDLFVCFLVKKVSGNQKRSEIFFNIAEVQSYIFCYKYCSPERTHFACVCVRARVCARGDLKVEPAPWLQSSIWERLDHTAADPAWTSPP